ncbi:MAG: hypothetical protein ACRDKZ_02100 [Actinomycetota bacterium]
MDLKDERGIVVSWLARIVIAVMVVGVLLYDSAAVGVNYFRLDAKASEIALELSNVGGDPRSNQWVLEKEALGLAQASGAQLVSVHQNPEKEVVLVKLERRAKTLVLERVGSLAEWATATATGRASTE